MKVAVIKGSPHKNGSSNLLAGEFIKGAREAGHEIIELDAAHMDIHPCLGCEHCGMNGPCIQKDDIAKIRDTLLSSDMAVFVTPIYYFGMSAQLKIASAEINGLYVRAYLNYFLEECQGQAITDELLERLAPYSRELPKKLFNPNSIYYDPSRFDEDEEEE